jgi:hypothetical protein
MTNKVLINMIGGNFQHDVCSSAGSIPTHIEWVKNIHSSPISIYIDYAIPQNTDKSKLNFAWLQESSTIFSSLHDWVKQNISFLEENFTYIFTHDTRLLHLSNKFKYVICNARPWVTDIGIHSKSKLVSMIASNKNMCYEHTVRQKAIEKFRSKLDLFGRDFHYIDNKITGLKDYAFSVAMENSTYPLGYTEKIADCFATGTIPIYYGCREISNIFNPDGILWLDDNFKLEDLSFDLYYTKMDAIKDNFNRIQSLPTAEDYIYTNYIKPIL